jgi:glycerol dehydrogenase-like iron-containing ADH family enzyme
MSSELKVFTSSEKYVQGRNAADRLYSRPKNEKASMLEGGTVIGYHLGNPERLTRKKIKSRFKITGITSQNSIFVVLVIADEALRTRARALIAFGGGQVIDAVRTATNLVGSNV